MIDISDGLSLDAVRLGSASGLGVALDTVPFAEGATEADALGGGEDYELLIAVKDPDRLVAMYAECGLTAPLKIGRMTIGAGNLFLRGEGIEAQGWVHDVS
jgi:thiamine-monophosphate kinase